MVLPRSGNASHSRYLSETLRETGDHDEDFSWFSQVLYACAGHTPQITDDSFVHCLSIIHNSSHTFNVI
jgi:hypothetical protein